MKSRILTICAISLFAISGCGPGREGSGTVRTAVGAPLIFNPPAGMAWGDNTCKNPIIDPIDGTELILIHSTLDGMGDYRVTGRKYGVNKGELLRINCNTGELIGIVRGR